MTPQRSSGSISVRRGLRAFGVAALCVAAACSRFYVEPPVGAQRLAAAEPLSVVYLIGDFGKPSRPFNDLTDALQRDVEQASDLGLRTAPMIFELGDNLYEDGLPHNLDAPGAQKEVGKLQAIATEFAEIRYRGAQVPLVLIPGNHDYGNDALVLEGNLGDISHWYFLDDLGIEGASAWTHIPGDAGPFAGAAELFAHIDGDAAAHAEFMAPMLVPGTDGGVSIIGIDSELLLDLYDTGRTDLADAYWVELGKALREVPDNNWTMIAAHHPPVTYGKHGEPSFGNWVFGQGWPQFPKTWQKALAVAMPLGVVLGIVVHPAAVAIAVAPPVSTALVTRRKQDVGSEPYDRYVDALLSVAADQDVDVILAGHDHNTQLIELDRAETADGSARGGDALLVVTGAGSKVDPVRRGPGTVAHLSDYSYVRMTQYAGGLAFEIADRSGAIRYRYEVGR